MSTDRPGAATVLISSASPEPGHAQSSQDDVVEIEDRALDARCDHAAGRFYDAAKARSEAASHAALDRNFYSRFAIDTQWLRDGPQRSVHRLGPTGVDVIGPLYEVTNQLCC